MPTPQLALIFPTVLGIGLMLSAAVLSLI